VGTPASRPNGKSLACVLTEPMDAGKEKKEKKQEGAGAQ
jgi:hypothetical protein